MFLCAFLSETGSCREREEIKVLLELCLDFQVYYGCRCWLHPFISIGACALAFSLVVGVNYHIVPTKHYRASAKPAQLRRAFVAMGHGKKVDRPSLYGMAVCARRVHLDSDRHFIR